MNEPTKEQIEKARVALQASFDTTFASASESGRGWPENAYLLPIAELIAAETAPLHEKIASLEKQLDDYHLRALPAKTLELEITAALAGQPAPIATLNQCDGCRAGRPVDKSGNHRMGDGDYPNLQACQRHLYSTAQPASTEDREAALAPFAQMQPDVCNTRNCNCASHDIAAPHERLLEGALVRLLETQSVSFSDEQAAAIDYACDKVLGRRIEPKEGHRRTIDSPCSEGTPRGPWTKYLRVAGRRGLSLPLTAGLRGLYGTGPRHVRSCPSD